MPLINNELLISGKIVAEDEVVNLNSYQLRRHNQISIIRFTETIMTFYLLIGLISLVLPLLIYMDNRIKKNSDANPLSEYDPNGRLSDSLILLAPYSVLFFAEEFWFNIVYLIPLYIYAVSIMLIAYKKDWSPVTPEIVIVAFPGSLTVTIIAYYIFFHNGIMSREAAQITETEIINAGQTQQLWPFWIYAVLLLVQLVIGIIERKNKKEAKVSVNFLFIQVAGFNILPLFTQHYWTLMFVGAFVFVSILTSVTERMEITMRGGIGFVLIYFYIMASVASIALYAFLF